MASRARASLSAEDDDEEYLALERAAEELRSIGYQALARRTDRKKKKQIKRALRGAVCHPSNSPRSEYKRISHLTYWVVHGRRAPTEADFEKWENAQTFGATRIQAAWRRYKAAGRFLRVLGQARRRNRLEGPRRRAAEARRLAEQEARRQAVERAEYDRRRLYSFYNWLLRKQREAREARATRRRAEAEEAEAGRRRREAHARRMRDILAKVEAQRAERARGAALRRAEAAAAAAAAADAAAANAARLPRAADLIGPHVEAAGVVNLPPITLDTLSALAGRAAAAARHDRRPAPPDLRDLMKPPSLPPV